MTHTLTVYNPGHFHAALLFFHGNPRVDATVHVYADNAPEAETFAAMLQGFNARDHEPTNWRVNPYIGDDALDRLIEDRKGEIVILAGRNGPRLELMHRLHDAGLNVLADKPWMTDSANLWHLDAITRGAPLAVDIMTGRYGATAELRNAVITSKDVFGALSTDQTTPAIEFFSRHHLLKTVDGRPLRRPPWFYDVAVQGDGMVDIHSHYVDQAQWIVDPDHHYDADQDIEILDAERWATEVPLDLFQESTGDAAFPDYLRDAVEGDVLRFACNGRIDYRLRGIRVRHHCEWGLREPDGGSDAHGFVARGENAELAIRHGPETDFKTEFRIRVGDNPQVDTAFEAWRAGFPGLEVTPAGDEYQLNLPSSANTPHEAQFPLVLDWFLSLVETGTFSEELAARIRARYTLIARARDHALGR
jgi:predicted dehydrogenase